jgi:hypothetical protein
MNTFNDVVILGRVSEETMGSNGLFTDGDGTHNCSFTSVNPC